MRSTFQLKVILENSPTFCEEAYYKCYTSIPQNLNKKGDIMLIPDFSENKDNSMLLYFDAEGKDINSMYTELEKTYVCFEKMNQTLKDGKKYVVLEVKNDE